MVFGICQILRGIFLPRPKGQPGYVGKSIEIRKRMQQHFSGKDRKSVKIQMNVKRVTYEVMGSELIALLYESDLIKQHQPLYNRAQRGTIYQYGLYQVDINGYIGLRIDRISSRPNGCQPVDALARDLNSPEGAWYANDGATPLGRWDYLVTSPEGAQYDDCPSECFRASIRISHFKVAMNIWSSFRCNENLVTRRITFFSG